MRHPLISYPWNCKALFDSRSNLNIKLWGFIKSEMTFSLPGSLAQSTLRFYFQRSQTC